jgi:hypothetical protein
MFQRRYSGKKISPSLFGGTPLACIFLSTLKEASRGKTGRSIMSLIKKPQQFLARALSY